MPDHRQAPRLPLLRGKGRGDGRAASAIRAAHRLQRNLLATITLTLLLFLASLPAHAQAVLDAVIARGTLRVGLTGDYRPFSIKDGDHFEGLDVDEAESLAKALGVKLEIVPTAWPTLMPDLLGGKFDIAMGGITITTDRAKTALFSTPVMKSGKTPITRCADQSKYQTLSDIDQPGTRVIYNPGGTNDRFAHANIHHARLIEFPNNATIFDQIVQNHADVMITDGVETRLQQHLHPELCALHPDQPFDHSELAYMLPRDLIWQQFVDTWLETQSLSGEQAAAVAKWLGG